MAVLPPMLAHDRRAREAVAREEGAHVFRHLAVVHGLRPRRGAVVAQIDREDPVCLAEPPRDARPVAARAEQAMQDDERRPLARFGVSQFQGHVRVFVRFGLTHILTNQKKRVTSRRYTKLTNLTYCSKGK